MVCQFVEKSTESTFLTFFLKTLIFFSGPFEPGYTWGGETHSPGEGSRTNHAPSPPPHHLIPYVFDS